MTIYDVRLSETARRQLGALSNKLQNRIKTGLRQLIDDPYKKRPKADIKKLKGPKRTYYRLRVGDYRAFYVVEEDIVKVAKLLPRDKAYDWLD